MHHVRRLALLVCSLSTLESLFAADPRPASVFTDHAVLQRDMPVPVWGTADAGAEVVVEFAGQKKTATADAAGTWSVKLDPMSASREARELRIYAAKNPAAPAVLTDLLVGEVWVGSGQSNMDMPVASYTGNDPVLAKNAEGSYPQLRLLRKGPGQQWEAATPDSIKRFSALLFSFGLPLHQQLDVPVGLMVGAVGGTPSGLWLSEDMYRADEACAAVAKKFAATYDFPKLKAKYDADKAKYDEQLAAWKTAAAAAKKEGKPAPPAIGRGPEMVAQAGECNRGRVGDLFEKFIRSYVGYGIKGVLWDQGESGTAIVGVDQYTLMGALIRGWRKAWGQGDFPFLYVQKPSGGGPAWDYANPVTAKANPFAPLPKVVAAANAGANRALHLRIMQHPNTFMVTSTDLGAGVHPVNKSGYGARAALVAQNAVYGGKGEYYGPLYASHESRDGGIVVRFSHTGRGLAFKHGDHLQGFAVAGADGKFAWADAKIDGDAVVVSSPAVPQPVHVRYAWDNAAPWANLFNQDGLPAQPFATDVKE